MERLVIYDSARADISGLYELGNHNPDFVIGERAEPLTPETADPTATMIAVFSTSRVDHSALARMPHLKLVLCLSVGADQVDVAECKKRGITVCNVPNYAQNTVAEYALMLMLALSRRLTETIGRLRAANHHPANLVGHDLSGKTLTVIGTGRIGQQLIGYAKALGMDVLAVDVTPKPALAERLGFRYVGLHDGLKQADIISLHVPLLADNYHLLNRQTLALMKPTALLVNTARGGLIDTTALLHALHTNALAGAALDVIEHEHLLQGKVELEVDEAGATKQTIKREIAEHEALLKLPNVILTGHNAFNSAEAHARLAAGGAQVIQAFLDGQPINVVI